MQEKEQIKWKVTGALTRERIDEHRKRLGMKLKPTGPYRYVNQWALWDRISLFADKMGDPNRLYRDQEYAKKTRYGALPAPPAYTWCSVAGLIIQGLPGVQIMVGGGAYEHIKPPLDGDRISSEVVFADLEEKSSAFSPLWLIEYWDCKYFNQRGELLAKGRSHTLRWERKDIDEGLKRTDKGRKALTEKPRTEQEARELEREVLAQYQQVRGPVPRYWEDVNVGDTLPDFVRGPRRYTDGVADGTLGSIIRSGALGLEEMRRHPGYALWHPESSAYEKIELIHWNKLLGQQMHYAHAYDYGIERQGGATIALTNWMGDDGWLKKHSANVRRIVYISDVLRVKTRITRKYVDEDGEYCVDLEQQTLNPRGDNVLPALATIALPSREHVTWPVARRVAAARP